MRAKYIGDGTGGQRLLFRCPGCDDNHVVLVTGKPKWDFDGDFALPTIKPSILVQYGKNKGNARCHSFVTKGQIKFLPDCTHELRGKTVDLPELP